MPEQIGLEGKFDLANWDAGIKRYQSQLADTIGKTNQAAGSFGKSWNQMGATVGKTTAIMGGALVAAGVAAGAAIGKFTFDGIRGAMDLQAQMSGIAAVLNTTREGVEPLKKLISELALDPNLVVSTTEAADAIEMLARNGLSMQEILDGAAHSTILLANATGADLATAGDIATNAMAIFKIEVKDMATAVNGITAVTNASQFGIEDYALALSAGGAAAATAGVSFADFNATITAISPSFTSGSDAGTSLKTAVQRMVPTTKEAADAMKQLGLDFFDASGQMKSMADISAMLNQVFMEEVSFSSQVSGMTGEQTKQKKLLEGQISKLTNELFLYESGVTSAGATEEEMAAKRQMLNQKLTAAQNAYGELAGILGTTVTTTRKLTEEERLHYLTTIFGTDAMRAAVGMAEAGVVMYTDLATATRETGFSQEELNAVLEGGITQFELLALAAAKVDAQKQAEERTRNLKAALTALGDTIENVQLQVGDLFLPMLEEMARWLKRIVDDHSAAIIGFFQSFIDNAIALGNYLKIVVTTGDLMNNWLNEMSPPLASVVLGVTALAGAISVGLGAALGFIQQHMDAFKGALIGIAAVLAAATITAGIAAIAGAIATLFTPIGLVILAAAALGAAWNTNFFGLRDTTLAVVAVVQEAFTPLTTAIQEFGSGALTEITNFVTGTQTQFTNLNAIWDGAKESAGNLLTALKEQFPTLTPVFDGFAVAVGLLVEQVKAQFTLLQEATSAFIGIVTSLISGDWAGAWQSAQDLAGAFVTYVQTTFANLSEVFATPFATIRTLVTETFTGLVTEVSAQLPGWQATLGEWGLAASQWIADASVIVAAKMTEWKTAVVDYVVTNLPTWQTTLAQWGTAASQWIVDAVAVVTAQMATWGTAVLGYVTDNLPTWTATLTSWGDAAWQWILDAIPGVQREIAAWYAELNVYVTNNLPTWIATLKEWGDAAWQWIVDAVPLVTTQLGTWGQAILNYVIDNLPTWTANLLSWGKAAWEWIVDATGTATTQIGVWGTAVLGYVTDNLPTWIANLTEWTTAAWQWIVDAVPLVTTQIGTWGTTILNYATDNLPTWEANLLGWTQAAWEWIVDAVPLVTTKLGEWFTALTDYLTTNLPTWQACFTEWTTAAWDWIVEAATTAVTELGKWASALGTYLTTTALPAFRTQMLEWATALVSWIGSAAADALPELGKWLGKITAWIVIGAAVLVVEMAKFVAAIISWIPGAIAQLPAKLAELKDALIGWIAGTGGAGGEGTLVAEADPAMQKFKDALVTALDGIKEGFLGAVQGFTRAFADTMSEFIDFEVVGRNVMTFFRNGISAMTDPITTKAGEIATAASEIFTTIVDWLQLGKDIIDFVIEGFEFMLASVATKAEELSKAAKKAWDDIDWLQLGKDIITGIKNGLEAKGGEIVSYIVGLGQQALDSIKGLFGIESPSKVFMEIGRNLIEGWLIGMQSMERRLLQSVQGIADGIARIARRAGDGAIVAYVKALDSFSSVAILNRVNVKDEAGNFLLPGAGLATGAIQQQQELLDFLKMQADLVEAIRESGASPGDVLAGITLGPNADPVQMARIVAETMERLNRGLISTLRVAASGVDKTIEEMRAARESVSDIEARFTEDHTSTLVRYKNDLAQLDKSIAEIEANILATGNQSQMRRLQALERTRLTSLAQIETILDQRRQMEMLLTDMPASSNQRVQSAMEEWRKRYITPLEEMFETASIARRAGLLGAIGQHRDLLHQFSQGIGQIVAAESRALEATEGFGERVQNRVSRLLDSLYNPAALNQRPEILQNLREFTDSLIRIRSELDRRTAGRRTGQEIIEQLTSGPRDLLTTFQDTIAAIDQRIETAQNRALETGNELMLQNVRLLDAERGAARERLREMLRLRQNRQSIEDIEEKFTTQHITTLERYAERLENIDLQIANAERSAMTTGRAGWMATLANLDNLRRGVLAEVETLFAQQRSLDQLLAQTPVSTNARAQAAIDQWRTTMIEPLIRSFDQLSIAGREGNLSALRGRMEMIQRFAANMPAIAGVEAHAMRALEGFGEAAAGRAENMLRLLYDPRNVISLNQNVAALYDFANGLIQLRGELERRAGRRLDTESIIDQVTGNFDQLRKFQNALAIIDQRIEQTTANMLETGNTALLGSLEHLDEQLFMQQSQLSTFLHQTQRLEGIMRQVKNLTGPGQASAERFLQEAIQPIVDMFSRPMGEQDRENWLRIAQERVGTLNRFVEQMRAVERLQARVAGNQLFASLADEFALLQDITMPEGQRTNLISQLNSYITQMMRLHQIQRDITVGRGINPLVDRFASERLDEVARQLENINLSEAERNRLIEQYRIEQEKILRLQERQQQLEFVNQQIALIEQLRSLDDEENWSVNVESILSGIQFGVNASIDDLMRLTGRVLDELVRFANHELGIASPSKVFAKVGTNIMAGLAAGIDASMRQPMMALRNATGNMIPYSLNQRSLAVNMGGVTINNGMDDVMFEARIRQIVRSEFGS